VVKHPEKHYQYKSDFEKMHMYSIRDQAVVLRDLKYGSDEAKARIKQNIEWENELFDLPAFYRHVDKIVDYVFSK